MKHIGIIIADRGSAIVQVERSPDDALLVVGIERLPSDLDVLAKRVLALEGPQTRSVIDAEGLGSALWAILGRPEDEEHWQLYAGRGFERQALVDELLVAMQENRFHFAAGLAEQEAMSKALQGWHKQVREDGVIGGELVVALLLALIPPPPEPVEPFVIFGRVR
ncbi:MAG: hypothetical protein ABSB75_04780 [Candidatus Limnocylindrales bacterium]